MNKTRILAFCMALFMFALSPMPAAATGIFDHPQEAPEPTMRLTVKVVDEAGKPLSNVCGTLDYNDGVTAMQIEMTPYESRDITATDKTGTMYFDLIPDWIKKGAYTLKLYAYYDHTLTQSFSVILPDSSKSYKVTWKEAAPPNVRPLQKQGIRFFVKDSKTGQPVQGVTLQGSPHSNEAWAANKVLHNNVIILGPSDENGYIRWDTAIPGTYEFGGEKGLLNQPFTITMPKDKVIHDIVLNWKPETGVGAGMNWGGPGTDPQ